SGPLFGGYPPPPITINGTPYSALGFAATEWDQAYNGIQHESLHLFRMNHSRNIANNLAVQSDYGDVYDVGSCLGCNGTPDKVFRDRGANIVGTPNAGPFAGGPGLNAVQLLTACESTRPCDSSLTAGWLAADRVLTLSSSSCAQQTVQLAALNHPEATGYLTV